MGPFWRIRFTDLNLIKNVWIHFASPLQSNKSVTSTCLCTVYLRLHHGWSLCPQHFDSLEDVHCSFITHPLQDNAQSDEDTRPPHTGAAGISTVDSECKVTLKHGRHEAHTWKQLVTCSELLSVHPGRTAPWSCELGRWSRWNPPRILAPLVLANRWTGTDAPSSTGHPKQMHGNNEVI